MKFKTIERNAMKRFAVTIFVTFVCVLVSAFAAAGGAGSGGGNHLGLEFEATGEAALSDLLAMRQPPFTSVDLNKLQQQINSAKVLVTDGPLAITRDGISQKGDAENRPGQNLIIVNGADFSKITSAAVRKAFALHEYLSLMGLESTGKYPISSAYLFAESGGSMNDANQTIDAASKSAATQPRVYARVAQILDVKGASNWTANTVTSNAIIYGGLAGPLPTASTTNCTLDGKNACNNCASTTVCNTRRIYPNLQLTVTAAIDDGLQPGVMNFAYLVAEGLNGTYQELNSSGQGQPVYSEGQNVSFTTTWGDVCTAFGANNTAESDCEPNSNPFNLYLVIQNTSTFNGQLVDSYQLIQVELLAPTDANLMGPCLGQASSTTDAYGICNFFAQAGNGEVHIENPAENMNCRYVGRAQTTAVRVYYVPDDGAQNFATISYASPHQDFQLDNNCNPVGDWVIKGLANRQGYYFLPSMLDAAHNSSLLLDNSVTSLIYRNNGGPCPAGGPYSIAEKFSCPYYAVPGMSKPRGQ